MFLLASYKQTSLERDLEEEFLQEKVHGFSSEDEEEGYLKRTVCIDARWLGSVFLLAL